MTPRQFLKTYGNRILNDWARETVPFNLDAYKGREERIGALRAIMTDLETSGKVPDRGDTSATHPQGRTRKDRSVG